MAWNTSKLLYSQKGNQLTDLALWKGHFLIFKNIELDEL